MLVESVILSENVMSFIYLYKKRNEYHAKIHMHFTVYYLLLFVLTFDFYAKIYFSEWNLL